MCRITRAVLAAVALGALSPVADAQTSIESTQGLAHVGETVRVRMAVKSMGRAGDQVELHSRASWREEDCFFVRLDAEAQAAYEKMGIKLPDYFARREIEVTGEVKTIKPGGLTRPVIIVSSPTSIRVLDSPAPPAIAAPLEIKPEQALQHVGKAVRVRLTVASIGRNGDMQELNSAETWDAPGNLQIRLAPEIVAAYAKQGIENPALHYLRKKVEVAGTVREIRPGGKSVAAIDLESTGDLKFVLESEREAPRVSELANRRIDLHLRDGAKFGNVLVVELETGTDPESVLSLKAKVGDAGPRLYRAIAIEEIVVDGVPLDLRYDRKARVLVVDQERRRQRLEDAAAIERQVLAKGGRNWPRLSDDEQAQWMSKHREFLESVRVAFPQLPLRVVETDYCLILTDIPDADARKYLGYLDTLYHQMCRAFGIPLGSNIWCGKCVVVALQNRADFIRFEIDVMKNTNGNPTQSGGICHADGDGRVVISLFKAEFTDRFATVLVHETSHGIAARFLSDVRLPSWLNEGMAVWIAKFVVKEDDSLEKHQQKSIEALREQQTLAGFFDAKQIPGELYGSASSIVDILLRMDAAKFRQFFTLIKQGVDQDEALKQSYDMTFADLARIYGTRIGLPNLSL